MHIQTLQNRNTGFIIGVTISDGSLWLAESHSSKNQSVTSLIHLNINALSWKGHIHSWLHYKRRLDILLSPPLTHIFLRSPPLSLCGAARSCPGLQCVQHDIPGLNGSYWEAAILERICPAQRCDQNVKIVRVLLWRTHKRWPENASRRL